MSDQLYRVVAPHFVAGVIVSPDGSIRSIAPILGWAKSRGFTFGFLRSWLMARGYEVTLVESMAS